MKVAPSERRTPWLLDRHRPASPLLSAFIHHGLFHRPWLASALRQARLIFARFACRNAQHVVGVSLQFRLAKSFDVPAAGRAILFVSLPECATNSQDECAKGHRDQPTLPNCHLLLGRSPLEWLELSVRHRVPQPSARSLAFFKTNVAVALTAVRLQGQADIGDCPEMSVPDPKQTSKLALTHPRTQCSNSCRLEPRSINSRDSNAPRSGKATLDDWGPTLCECR